MLVIEPVIISVDNFIGNSVLAFSFIYSLEKSPISREPPSTSVWRHVHWWLIGALGIFTVLNWSLRHLWSLIIQCSIEEFAVGRLVPKRKSNWWQFNWRTCEFRLEPAGWGLAPCVRFVHGGIISLFWVFLSLPELCLIDVRVASLYRTTFVLTAFKWRYLSFPQRSHIHFKSWSLFGTELAWWSIASSFGLFDTETPPPLRHEIKRRIILAVIVFNAISIESCIGDIERILEQLFLERPKALLTSLR